MFSLAKGRRMQGRQLPRTVLHERLAARERKIDELLNCMQYYRRLLGIAKRLLAEHQVAFDG